MQQHTPKLLALCAFLLVINSSSGAPFQMEIQMGGGKHNCAKYTTNGLDFLTITHARVLIVDETLEVAKETKLIGNLLCKIKKFENKKYFLDCDGIVPKQTTKLGYFFMFSVTAKKQMLSGPIDYRYKEDVMQMVKNGFLEPSNLESQTFDHERHIHIASVKLTGSSIETHFPSMRDCQGTYPERLIADHGLYFMTGEKGNSLVRMYYEPTGIDSYLVQP